MKFPGFLKNNILTGSQIQGYQLNEYLYIYIVVDTFMAQWNQDTYKFLCLMKCSSTTILNSGVSNFWLSL